MSSIERGRVYHVSKTDKFLNLRTASQKSSWMVEARQDMWEARKLLLECLAVQGLTQIFTWVLGAIQWHAVVITTSQAKQAVPQSTPGLWPWPPAQLCC